MHFGLFCLNPQRDAAKSPREIYQETTDQVRLAEQIGFDIAWFAEHHFSNYCLCPSPVTMATYMAGLTKRIRLGTAVIVAPLYQPLRMLEDLAVLDQLSDGRAVLGFGSGYQQYEFHKFGVDLKAGRDIFLETLEVGLEVGVAGRQRDIDAGRGMADGGVGVAGGRAAVPGGETAISEIASGVHLAGTADQGIFLVDHRWIVAGGGTDGISGGVLFDRQSFRSLGAARIEL